MLNKPGLIAAVGIAAVAGAVGANLILWQDEVMDTPEKAARATTEQPPPAAGKPPATAEQPPATAEQPPATADQPTADSETAKPPPAKPEPVPPSFDVVRISPDGNAVIAGRAEPKSTVAILSDGQFVGQLEADSRGEWVYLPERPLEPGSRQLSLEMHIAGMDPIRSDNVVVLVVPKRETTVAGIGTATATDAVKPITPRVLAVKIPRTGDGGSTVMQKPGADGVTSFSLDAIDYDDEGRLNISGRAAPRANVYVYLDNDYIGQTQADDRGLWRLLPPSRIEPGLYTLRADRVDSGGRVLARVSMPFSRAEPHTDLPPEPFVVVQPGNSLWRLARRTYGSGFRYSIIYEANKDQIRDPDLIYPGQIFALPATN